MKKRFFLIFGFIFVFVLFFLNIFILDDKSQLLGALNKNVIDTNDVSLSKISDLNKSIKIVDSNKLDTNSSKLEINYREIHSLPIDSSIKGYGDDPVNNSPYFSYPRLLKLKNNKSEYKYVLVYQVTQEKIYLDNTKKDSSLNENGLDVYYTRSKDLINWEKPRLLFQSNYNDINRINSTGVVYPYYGTDLLELKDGRIMAMSAKWSLGIAGFTAEQFNKRGIYVRYSSDGGNTWTPEEQIYAGPCWDPSAIQLDSGEIQVYMTHFAPTAYMQSLQFQPGAKKVEYFAKTSPQQTSSGVGMISSLDNGKTWTPNIKGTTIKYDSVEASKSDYRNPYSAYRVAQEYIQDKLTGERFNFYGKLASNGQIHYGIQESSNVLTKMTNGMASPLVLNNKSRVVLPMETANILMEKATINGVEQEVTKYTNSISLAYSNGKKVTINGVSKYKFWLDINNQTKTNFSNEKLVYDSEGLKLTEVGPVNRHSHVVQKGSGPDIAQFPSGETLLSYHLWPNMKIKIGNADAVFSSNDDGMTISGISFWGGMTVVDSHKVLLVKANGTSNKDAKIIFTPLYLNHTLDVKNEKFSSTNDDALFIGSDSQAQLTIRANYDSDNIYFTLDRLDSYLTSKDLVGLYITSNNLKYKGASYDYLHITASRKEATVIEVVKNGNRTAIKDVNVVVKENNTGDSSGGYKTVITIPRATFNFLDNTLKVHAALKNTDADGKETYDTMTGTKLNNIDTWVKLNFVTPTVAEVKYNKTSTTSDPVIATVNFNSSDVVITNNNGKNSYTFTDNGEFTFNYRDKNGSVGSVKAKVDWIKKSNNNNNNNNSEPKATIEYSTTEETNKNVVATIKFDRDNIVITNNNGKNSYTFTNNGEFEFKYKDSTGKTYSKVAKVTWIKKETTYTEPKAIIEYSTTEETNGYVVATIKFDRDNVKVINNDGKITYTFNSNGEFEFKYKDETGKTFSKVAKVSWIKKANNDKLNAVIEYSITEETTESVIATIKFNKDNVEIINNNGENSYTFTSNGEFEFKYKDSTGNVYSLTAKVSWIKAADNNEYIDNNYSENQPNILIIVIIVISIGIICGLSMFFYRRKKKNVGFM